MSYDICYDNTDIQFELEKFIIRPKLYSYLPIEMIRVDYLYYQ